MIYPPYDLSRAAVQELYTRYLASEGVSTDTRTLKPGQWFFALSGPSFDGNRFATTALEAGAAGLVVNQGRAPKGASSEQVIEVPNPLRALQALAWWKRKQFKGPVLAITGSNGKTTTKELVREVLAHRFQVFATPGNFNNHIGLPISILQAPAESDYWVLEMGDNQPGDIDELCRIAAPDLGLITNLGLDHLVGYASLEANKAGKLELVDYLLETGGGLFQHRKLPELNKWIRKLPRIERTYAPFPDGADLAGAVEANHPRGINVFYIWKGGNHGYIQTQLPGAFNLDNVLAALCLGIHYEVPRVPLEQAIAGYTPRNNRSQWVRTPDGKQLLLDAYNANPSSLFPALENLVAVARVTDRLGVVLGAMEELGDAEAHYHQELGQKLAAIRPEAAILVGDAMKAAQASYTSRNAHWFATTEAACEAAPQLLAGCTLILLKGSRRWHLEDVAKAMGAEV